MAEPGYRSFANSQHEALVVAQARVAELEAALRGLCEALPAYFGLAVYLDGEQDAFNAAEGAIERAFLDAQDALKGKSAE